MKSFFGSLFFMFISIALTAQALERKIIIENKHFYYTTIDAEFQIATLHIGNVSEALKTGGNLALPAGRNYDDPINPFSWDVLKDDFYAVSFLNHPLNDRNEALKRVKISSLQEWDNNKVTVLSMIMKSIDLPPFAYNDPYLSTIKRSNTLNNFFYDGIAISDSSYYMVITNNGELSIWNYNGLAWKSSEIQKIPVDGFFTLFELKKHPYLILNNGQVYEISTKTN
ncbi:MAG: hypothetical protein ACXVNN_02385, partial [Bacteroidia bacterium]